MRDLVLVVFLICSRFVFLMVSFVNVEHADTTLHSLTPANCTLINFKGFYIT